MSFGKSLLQSTQCLLQPWFSVMWRQLMNQKKTRLVVQVVALEGINMNFPGQKITFPLLWTAHVHTVTCPYLSSCRCGSANFICTSRYIWFALKHKALSCHSPISQLNNMIWRVTVFNFHQTCSSSCNHSKFDLKSGPGKRYQAVWSCQSGPHPPAK